MEWQELANDKILQNRLEAASTEAEFVSMFLQAVGPEFLSRDHNRYTGSRLTSHAHWYYGYIQKRKSRSA